MDSIVSRTLPPAPGAYATAAEVRAMSGLSDSYDISDPDLEEVILHSTLKMIDDITVRMDGVEVMVLDDQGSTFQLPVGLIADVDANAKVEPADMTVRFYATDDDGTILTSDPGLVTIQSAKFGIFQTQFTLPEGYQCVVDYAHYHRPLDLERAKRAVRFLASHIAIQRVKAPGRITRADLNGVARVDEDDKREWLTLHRSKFLRHYWSEARKLTGVGFL